jgi:hypothetical protein
MLVRKLVDRYKKVSAVERNSFNFYFTSYHLLYIDIIYLTAFGLTHGGSSTVHIYTQTIHRKTQSTQTIYRKNNRHKQYIEKHNRYQQYIEQHSSLIGKSADRTPSLQGIHWHLPYN